MHRVSKQLSKVMVERRQDNALVLIPSSGNMSMHAPTQKGKSKGCHRINVKFGFPKK